MPWRALLFLLVTLFTGTAQASQDLYNLLQHPPADPTRTSPEYQQIESGFMGFLSGTEKVSVQVFDANTQKPITDFRVVAIADSDIKKLGHVGVEMSTFTQVEEVKNQEGKGDIQRLAKTGYQMTFGAKGHESVTMNVDVPPAQEPIKVALEPAVGMISGRILNSKDKTPLKDVEVTVSEETFEDGLKEHLSTLTDQNGEFSLKNLRIKSGNNNSSSVHFTKEGFDWKSISMPKNKFPNYRFPDIDLNLSIKVQGQLLDGDNKPLADTLIFIVPEKNYEIAMQFDSFWRAFNPTKGYPNPARGFMTNKEGKFMIEQPWSGNFVVLYGSGFDKKIVLKPGDDINLELIRKF